VSDWQDEREKRYLDAQRWIVVLIVLALAWVAFSGVALNRLDDPAREVTIAARACWDQGMRAVLHRDGRIECRP
jgi:hypothetical protein